MMGLSDGRKSFPIGLAVLIQYRSVTVTQPATQPRCRSYYAQRSRVEPKNVNKKVLPTGFEPEALMSKANFVPLSHMSTWFRHPMYLFKYIYLWILYIRVTQYYSLLSVLRISSTWAVTNNSLKHVHVCHSLDVTALWQRITTALWRAYSQLRWRQSYLRCSILWYEGSKISALLVQYFKRRPPSFWHVFGTAHCCL